VPLSIYSTMPKNYKQGELYELRCRKTGRVYVGSRGTTEEERMTSHTKNLILFKQQGLINCYSYLVLESNDYVVNTIESYPCECDVDVCTSDDCKKRLCRREGEYIRQYRDEFGELCVNKRIEGRTKNEYYNDTRETILKTKKDNFDNNPELYKKHMETVLRPHTCELCGATVSRCHLKRHQRSLICFKNSCDSMNLIEI